MAIEFLDDVKVGASLEITGTLKDSGGSVGTSGQVLSSTATGTNWITSSGTNIGDSDLTTTDASRTLTLYNSSSLFSIYRAGGSELLAQFYPDIVAFNSNNVYITSPTGETSAPTLHLREAQSNGSSEIGLRAPDSLAASSTYTLPGTMATAGQVLSSSAGGVMSWIDAGGADTNIANSDLTLTGSTRNLTYFSSGGTLNFVYDSLTRQSFSSQAVSFFSSFYLRSPSGSTSPPVMRFSEAQVNGSNFVSLQAAASLTANTSYTLPTADGTSGQALTTDGGGNMSWATPSVPAVSTFNLITSGGGRVSITTTSDNGARAMVLGGTLGFNYYNWTSEMNSSDIVNLSGLSSPGTTTEDVRPYIANQGVFRVLTTGDVVIQGTIEGGNFSDVYSQDIYIYVFRVPSSIVTAMGNGGVQNTTAYELVASARCTMPSSLASTRPQLFVSGNGVEVDKGDWVFAAMTFDSTVTTTRYFPINFQIYTAT